MSYLKIDDFLIRLKLYFLCFGNQNKLKKYLKNKSIAIVGNASGLFEQNFAKQIDNHDVVIRFNKGFIVKPDAQGVKTDIWASSASVSRQELLENFPKLEQIIWLTPKLSVMEKYDKKIYSKMTIYPFICWFKLFRKIKSRPTSGAMLIDYIARYVDFSKCDVYGFDFFKSNSFYNETELATLKQHTPHDFGLEEKYVQEICKKRGIKIN